MYKRLLMLTYIHQHGISISVRIYSSCDIHHACAHMFISANVHMCICVCAHYINMHECSAYVHNSTVAEIQLPLKRFPDSSVSSLIRTGWCGRASNNQNLAPTFPGINSCLMVTKWDFLEMEASVYD